MAGTVVDNDRGFKAMMQRVQQLKNKAHVEVGVFESAEKHEGSKFTVAEIAAVHEFGSGKIPQRSFIRDTYDEKLAENRRLIKQLHGEVLLGKRSETSALTLVGEVVSKQMVEKINNGISPELAPMTVKAKGSNKPLIDTGQLKGAITFKVARGTRWL